MIKLHDSQKIIYRNHLELTCTCTSSSTGARSLRALKFILKILKNTHTHKVNYKQKQNFNCVQTVGYMYSCYFFKAPSICRSEGRVWISFYTFNGHPKFSGLNKVNKGGQYCIKMAQNDHLFQYSMF